MQAILGRQQQWYARNITAAGRIFESPSRARTRLVFTAAPIHPSQKESTAMLEEADRFLKRLESNAPPLAGSGHKWIADSTATDERNANNALIESLALAIGEQQHPGGLAEILKQIIEPGVRCSTNDNSPGYMAYVPSGGLFHSAVASLIGTAMNRYVTIDQAAPVFAAIERECVAWMGKEVVGWPEGGPSGGVLTSGGAMANMLGLHAARSTKIKNDMLPMATVYVSEQAHYCVEMGAKFIGVQPGHIRRVPSNPLDFSMNLDSLQRMLEADIEKGLVPMVVCAMAGTTNTGAVDDMEGIAKICGEKDVWMHVDGAYGGFFGLTSEGRAVLKGLEKADSVVMDPHKSLFLPYGLGALLVRNQFALQKGNRSDGACMQPPAAGSITDIEDIMNLSPELTRDFRGLNMWLPLQMLGAGAFRAQLEEKLALTRHAAARIGDGSIPNLQIIAQPKLSIFTFRLDDGIKKGAELDAFNVELLNRIHERGNVLLSPLRSVTGTAGELSIRMAILSHRTDLAIVDKAIADVRASALEVQGLTANGAGRAYLVTSAADDFVKDYKELAQMDVWDGLLDDTSGRIRVLDACAGTGRWLQAFSEIVVKDREVTVDCMDLCGDSITALGKRQESLGNIGKGKLLEGDLCELGHVGVPSLIYDVITNMHGLYGIPKHLLPAALQGMHDALKPGGTMIISIGTQNSPYQQIPHFFGAPFIDDADILQALSGLGIKSSCKLITYEEEFAAADKAGVEHFLMDECGGNTYPTDVAQQMEMPKVAIQKYADAHLDYTSGSYRFKQEVAVITVQRDAFLLPEMQSFGPFYSEAYTLRREASTMQSNMITWLRTKAEQYILQKCARGVGERLRICSIGCGDGELDLALIEGIARTVESCGFSGIDFVGLEPSPSFRQKFMDNMHEAQSRGVFPSPEFCKFQLDGEVFVPNKISEHAKDGEADIVLLGHVMYYFQNKGEGLTCAMQKARPGGVTVVIHQGKQGVPELQEALLPELRGSVRDMFTADDIDELLSSGGSYFERHDVDAFLDISEVISGSDAGMKIMSFCLEADHRIANDVTLKKTRDAFAGAAVPSAETGRSGGPFLHEPVTCFVACTVAQV